MNPHEDDHTLEEEYHQLGARDGELAGTAEGWKDGYVTGLRQGASLASEMGYYEGFSRAWVAILETPTQDQEDPSRTKKKAALKVLLDLVSDFPLETTDLKEDDDVKQKLVRIRAKYRQVNALLGGPRWRAPGPSWGKTKGVEESNGNTTTSLDIDF